MSIPSFLCVFYDVNFATNIKTLKLSELHKICHEYQNVASFATIFAQNWKLCKVKEHHKLETTAN